MKTTSMSPMNQRLTTKIQAKACTSRQLMMSLKEVLLQMRTETLLVMAAMSVSATNRPNTAF